MKLQRILVAASVAWAAGCTGVIDAPGPMVGGGNAGGQGPGGRGGGGNVGGAGSGGGISAGSCPVSSTAVLPIGSAPLRRLTKAEYYATVRDLFAGITVPHVDLPLDAASGDGFENRADLLKASDILTEQHNESARRIAEMAVSQRAKILPCTPAPDEAACGAKFVETFGARAFRRPLTGEEKTGYTALFNEVRTAATFDVALEVTLGAFLQSPHFLYRVEFGVPSTAKGGRIQLTDYELATRLSYLLWGSMPDEELFAAARDAKLRQPAELEAQARRLLADGRARAATVEFHRQWLDFDAVFRGENKDKTRYPEYAPALQDAMREESDRFVGSVMMDGDASVKSLLTRNVTMVNAALAKLYGVVPVPASGWAEATLDPTQRAGLLTQANFLTARSRIFNGSPPVRGSFVVSRVLCGSFPPPPAGADTSEPKQLAAGPKTNRQLFEERNVGTCAACHAQMNGIGYGLENYDAIGRYRTTEKWTGLDVDASGQIVGTDVDGAFNGGVDLSKKLAGSEQVQTCAASKWFRYAFGRDQEDADACKIIFLGKLLAGSGGNVREMLVGLVKTSDFQYLPQATP